MTFMKGMLKALSSAAAAAAAVAAALILLPALPARAEAGSTSPLIQAALERAVTVAGARLEASVETAPPRGCRPAEAEAPRPFDGSGRVAVRLTGRTAAGDPCEGWAWVRVRVFAPAPVTTRALRAGDPLKAAVMLQDREIRAGHPPAAEHLLATAVASRALPAGHLVEADHARGPSARPGDPLKVVVISGSLVIEQTGRSVPCARGRTCAILPSRKQVEGDLIDGRLVVQSP
jgi:hypothetical protein